MAVRGDHSKISTSGMQGSRVEFVSYLTMKNQPAIVKNLK